MVLGLSLTCCKSGGCLRGREEKLWTMRLVSTLHTGRRSRYCWRWRVRLRFLDISELQWSTLVRLGAEVDTLAVHKVAVNADSGDALTIVICTIFNVLDHFCWATSALFSAIPRDMEGYSGGFAIMRADYRLSALDFCIIAVFMFSSDATCRMAEDEGGEVGEGRSRDEGLSECDFHCYDGKANVFGVESVWMCMSISPEAGLNKKWQTYRSLWNESVRTRY